MEQSHTKLLTYVIDADGRLDPTYARRVFANSVLTPEFFYTYDPKGNTFTSSEAAVLYEFAREQFEMYDAPASIEVIVTEVMRRSELNAFQKERLNTALLAISQLGVNPNDFEYSIDKVLEEYTAAKSLSIMQKGAETIKTDPRGGVDYVLQGLATVLSYQRGDELAIDRTLSLAQLADYLRAEMQETGAIMSGTVPYPYAEANKLLGGMAPGELIVIAGQSGGGKSFIGHDIAFHAALHLGIDTVCADREMLHPQNGLRFLSRQTQLPSRKLRNRDYRTRAEDAMVEAALDEYAAIVQESDPILFIPPKLCINTNMIKREIDKNWGGRRPQLIIADYLTEFEPTVKREGWEGVRQVAHDLKQLALYYACPVVTMAQLNKRGEVQYSAIKQICDTLIMLETDPNCAYDPPKANEFVGTPGLIHCVIDKARNEANGVFFTLEVEFATSSIKSAPMFGRTAVGRALPDNVPDTSLDDVGVPE